MIPKRFRQLTFSILISGVMSCIVSFVATVRSLGFSAEMLGAWISAWSFSWPVAAVVIFFVGPAVRWLVDQLVEKDP